MDRSFLSQPEVITASRQFVCIRTATYEDAEEARVLATMIRTGSGQLENTVFAILTPEASRHLVQPGRSPRWAFRTSAEMAAGMRKISAHYAAEAQPLASAPLPKIARFRLALDVAACDSQPLVAVVADDPAMRKRLEGRLAPLSWQPELVGRCAFTSATAKELHAVSGVKIRSGVLVIAPDKFGLKGVVTAQVDAAAAPARLKAELRAALDRYQPEYKDHFQQMREGFRKDIYWDTAIPPTDPHTPYRPRPAKPGDGS